MIDSAAIVKTQGRLHHSNGAFADYITLHFSSEGLRFRNIDQSDPLVKVKDIAHLRYFKARQRGEDNPVIITFLPLEQDRPVAEVFPGLSYHTDGGETLLSANSFITYTMRTLLKRSWLYYEKNTWRVDTPSSETVWQERGQAVINLLTAQHRLHLELGPGRRPPVRLAFDDPFLDVNKNLISLGRCGFLSDLVGQERPRLVFNTAYFLLEPDDFFSHHSSLGEAYGLWVTGGTIARPPLYRRGAIFQASNGRWSVSLLSLNDISITLPNGLPLFHRSAPLRAGGLPFTLNDEGPSELTIYTRYYGVASRGRVLGYTPTEPGRFELTVVDRRIVGWKMGGNLALPQNGLVISISPDVLSPASGDELQNILRARFLLDFNFVDPEHRAISQAIQTGPILLQDGRSPLTNTYLEDKEQFWPSRTLETGDWQIGVVSTDFPTDIDQTQHGRVGLGMDRSGNLILVMVAGVNSGMAVDGVDSVGATLSELTRLLIEAGAVSAVNLDGGGSAQAYYLGGRALIPGDRRGLFQIHYERMVPSIGVLS
jgi:hypothetical protein